MTQCTSTTGAYISRITSSAIVILSCVAGLEGGDDVLRSGDAAEGVIQLGLGLALQEHRRVARVGDGVLDVVALVEQVRVGGGRVEGEHDGARLQLRDDLGRDRAERDVGHGEDHHIGVGDRGCGVGDLAAGVAGALLAGRRVLAVETSWVLRCRLSDTRMPILPPAPITAMVSWPVGLLLSVMLACSLGSQGCAGSTGLRCWQVVALSPCQGSQCSTIWLMPRSVGLHGVDQVVVVEQPSPSGQPAKVNPTQPSWRLKAKSLTWMLRTYGAVSSIVLRRVLERRDAVRRVEADAERQASRRRRRCRPRVRTGTCS